MARCDYCGTNILFGGVKDEGLRFCNQTCHQHGYLLAIADQVPEDLMARHLNEAHQGNCPKCNGPGPIDVHTSHVVWSALVMTSWSSRPQVCCRKCGIKSKLGGTAISGVAGWWGFPWGVIITPIQVLRNLFGLFVSPDPEIPSKQLETIVKMNLAGNFLENSRSSQAEA
jgi:hypothetical protein